MNPTQLANYRTAMAHAGAKNDPGDAKLLCQFLRHYRDQLRPLMLDDPATREIALLAEDRRVAVEQRVATTLQLQAVLKLYFPLVLKLVDAQLYATFIQVLLLKWPTLAKLQAVAVMRLRAFFYGHNVHGVIVEKRLDLIRAASPLTTDSAQLAAGARRAHKCAALLKAFNTTIDAYDKRLQDAIRARRLRARRFTPWLRPADADAVDRRLGDESRTILFGRRHPTPERHRPDPRAAARTRSITAGLAPSFSSRRFTTTPASLSAPVTGRRLTIRCKSPKAKRNRRPAEPLTDLLADCSVTVH